MKQLLQITEKTLTDMKISVGHKMKILIGIKNISGSFPEPV